MNTTTTDETTLYIETDEFNQFTQMYQVVNEEDIISSDTKFYSEWTSFPILVCLLIIGS